MMLFLSGCRKESPELRDFAGTYRSFHEAGDVEGLMSLVQQKDADPLHLERLQVAFEKEIRWPVASISIVAANEADTIDHFLSHGFEPNLPPQWKVLIQLDTEDRLTTTWLAGDAGEGLRLILAREKKAE